MAGCPAFFTSLGFHSLHAQQIHVGLTTAANATFVLDKGLSEDPRYNSTYTFNMAPIGFNFGVDLGRTFGLSLESIMSKQGQIYEIIDAAKQVKGERKIDLNYLQIPLLMKFMSGGTGGARANFNLGPQLNILTKAVESMQYDAGTYQIPNDPDFQLPEGASDNGDGTYSTPEFSPTDIYTKEANDFKNTEFSIAAAFGLDIDLSRHLMLTTQIRANYSPSDMRNGDVVDAIKNGTSSDIFGQRANLLVGIQLGIHYSFGTTRSFKFKN
ncbi:MAG: PorT family protein [Bacteroidia bacterium]|nr:PorT family protein [Bacteroidia bacterium]